MIWVTPAWADDIDPGFVETCTVARCAGESKTCEGSVERGGSAEPQRPDCEAAEKEGWTSVCRTGQSPWHWTEVMCKPDPEGKLEAPPDGSWWCSTTAPVGGFALLGLLSLRRRKMR